MSNGDADRSRRAEARTLIVLEDEANLGDALVDKTETLGRGDHGLAEVTVMRLRHASGCGHFLRTAECVGGVCGVCRRLLCSECTKNGNNLCAICRRPVCGHCQRWVRLRRLSQMVCRSCVFRAWLSEPGQILKRLLWLALLFWLFRKFFGGFVGL